MKIQMIGVDHTRAPVEIRERFSFTTTQAAAAMASVCGRPEIEGCVLLTTCNRTELWIYGEAVDLPGLLCGCKGFNAADYMEYFVLREEEEAVRYLFALAGGLQSRVLGEDQILGQVKKALDQAREVHCCGSVLEVLFRNAITGAKKVKTELLLSTANASVAELAIEQMWAQGFDFAGKRGLVIGSGEMGKRAVTALQKYGAAVAVTIRQHRSGHVAVLSGCDRIGYDARYAVIPDCDVVVSATSSPNVTIRREALEACALDRDILFLDFAVPRDIDPEIAGLPHVTLRNIDDFAVTRSDALLDQLGRAEELLREQQEKFTDWFTCRELLPRIDRLAGWLTNEMDVPEKHGIAAKRMRKLFFAVRDAGGEAALRACIAAMEQVTEDA